MNIKTVGLVAKVTSPLASEAIESVTRFLTERNVTYLLDKETAAHVESHGVDKMELIASSDLIVVLGGDGTFLSVARMMDDDTKPIMGINLGSLGFLTEFSYDQTLPALALILDGEYIAEDRLMIDVTIKREGKTVANYTALNDLVIGRTAVARMVQLLVRVDGAFFNDYTADGIIIATPTGSTAYNLSSGGPILYPTLDALIVSPICPHTLSNRPVVIPDSAQIEISLSPAHSGEAVATLDGQVGYQISPRDSVTVRRSKQVTRMILAPHKTYYKLLREKLKWGETIRTKSSDTDG